VTRRARILATALVAALLFAGTASARPSAPAAGGFHQHLVKGGLNYPAAFTFAPNGTIFFNERTTGNVRILHPSSGTTPLFFHVTNVATSGEQGLLGIALHPHFPSTPYVYVYATRNVNGHLRNQIIRITDSNGKGANARVIFTSSTVPGDYHDGGRILFGPDGNLYVVIGEAHSPATAQNLNVSGGKILRMTPAGGVPKGNPFANSRVWSYGVRNSFGLAFDPRSGHLWETENGPECNDELNRPIKGRNGGWGPNETCSTPPSPPRNTNRDGPNPVLPKLWYSPTIAPTGIAFCRRCNLGAASSGKLFFGAYNTGEIRRVGLTANRLGVTGQSVVFDHGSGILSMEVGPNRSLYFSDSGGIYRLTHS